ncbi:MAG: hypothetical protein GC129_04490 [Proteobacteria bacterium]|nr:hypothetical protein [Pseudomonadota bacterium]
MSAHKPASEHTGVSPPRVSVHQAGFLAKSSILQLQEQVANGNQAATLELKEITRLVCPPAA